jgi:CheY-like chemotaxis protein
MRVANRESTRPILLVDDSAVDCALARRALLAAEVHNPLVEVAGADEALTWLRARAIAGDMPLAVFLDVRMPSKSGIEALREIRGDPSLANLPVVMLTGSELGDDMRASYTNGANSYVVKPADADRFMRDVGRMGIYWATHNQASR